MSRKSKAHFEHVSLEIAILKKQPEGRVCWVEVAGNLELAKEQSNLSQDIFMAST
jgi:hypothetical protein